MEVKGPTKALLKPRNENLVYKTIIDDSITKTPMMLFLELDSYNYLWNSNGKLLEKVTLPINLQLVVALQFGTNLLPLLRVEPLQWHSHLLTIKSATLKVVGKDDIKNTLLGCPLHFLGAKRQQCLKWIPEIQQNSSYKCSYGCGGRGHYTQSLKFDMAPRIAFSPGEEALELLWELELEYLEEHLTLIDPKTLVEDDIKKKSTDTEQHEKEKEEKDSDYEFEEETDFGSFSEARNITHLQDFSLSCGGQLFPCSRFILGARSKVFSDIFAASTEADKKDDKASLEVEDCTPEVMELFLQLLYSNKAKIGQENASMLYKIGVRYQVSVVIRCARQALISGLKRDNVSSRATLAVQNDDQELLDASVEKLKKFKAELNEVPGWKDMDTKHQVAILTKLL